MKLRKGLFALSVGLLAIGAYVAVQETALPEWLGLSAMMGKSTTAEPGWVVEYVDGSGNPIQPSAGSANLLVKATGGWRNWFSIGGSAGASKLVGAPSVSAGQCQSAPGSTKRR